MKMRHISMAKRVCIILPFYLFTFLPSFAQTFTQRLQKQTKGGGIVTLHQDKAIDELVNGPKAIAVPRPTTVKPAIKKDISHIKAPTVTPVAKKKEEKPVAVPTAVKPRQNDTLVTVAHPIQTTVDSTLAKPKRTYRTTGYRVQVFAGGNSRQDRQRAEQIGNQLRSLFPEHQVYVHFFSPRWICRIGNFKEYDEAVKMKGELKQMGYGSTTIVKGKITLPL
jgi:hypothetical protein